MFCVLGIRYAHAAEGVSMGALMLNCPTTGRDFSTGINLDQDTFRKLPNTVTKARCPHCGSTHRWWTHEARWVDNIPPSQWVESFERAS
jgi:hypothetical protein